MPGSRRKRRTHPTPSKRAIKKHWEKRVLENGWGNFDSAKEYYEEDYCFACGMTDGRPTWRCHIQPVCKDGPNEAENIHLLCTTCHRASEALYGEEYWDWLKSWSPEHMMIARLMQYASGPFTLVLLKELPWHILDEHFMEIMTKHRRVIPTHAP